MKKIIGIVIASLVFCNVGFAKTTLIEHDRVQVRSYESSEYFVSTICVDGYKFVVTRPGSTASISMVQFFEERNEKSVPAKC